MSSRRGFFVPGIALGLFVTLIVAGAFLTYVTIYTGTDRVLPGVHVGQADVGRLRAREAVRRISDGMKWREEIRAATSAGAAETVQGAAAAATGRATPSPGKQATAVPAGARESLELRAAGRVWLLNRTETGPVPDVHRAVQTALTIGREGTILHRLRAYMTGWMHGHYVPIPLKLPEQVIRSRLEQIAGEVAIPPVDAVYDFATGRLVPEAAGQEIDVATSLELVRKALLLDQPAVDLVIRPVKATVQASDLIAAQQYQLTRFTTRILSADPGRVQNISMAVKKISGTLLRPGQVFSFNEMVGPRDADHGWAQANEIYQGEFVLGYGGGICQVSSTLYNAALLAGLEIKERYHHERPLEYVGPGRDATVVWKVLDFRFRNSLDQPVLIGARVLPGTPQRIEVAFYSQQPLQEAPILLEEADIKYIPPQLAEIPDQALPKGERKVVNEGYYGIEIKIYRHFGGGTGRSKELVSHDRYQPKAGQVRVGVGNGPGSERLLNPGLQ